MPVNPLSNRRSRFFHLGSAVARTMLVSSCKNVCLLNQEANAATETDKKKIGNERSARQTMLADRAEMLLPCIGYGRVRFCIMKFQRRF